MKPADAIVKRDRNDRSHLSPTDLIREDVAEALRCGESAGSVARDDRGRSEPVEVIVQADARQVIHRARAETCLTCREQRNEGRRRAHKLIAVLNIEREVRRDHLLDANADCAGLLPEAERVARARPGAECRSGKAGERVADRPVGGAAGEIDQDIVGEEEVIESIADADPQRAKGIDPSRRGEAANAADGSGQRSSRGDRTMDGRRVGIGRNADDDVPGKAVIATDVAAAERPENESPVGETKRVAK